MDIKKLLKKSSIAKNMGTSVTVISVCFRIIKQHYAITNDLEGYIRHNILFVKWAPRDIAITIFRDKKELLRMINAELVKFDFKYVMKDIISK